MSVPLVQPPVCPPAEPTVNIPGPTGPAGPASPVGATGPGGATIYNGAGAPGIALGNDGDYYLDTATSDFYYKSAGTWAIAVNFTGPAGATGSSGGIQYNGAGAPAIGLGVNGDYYIDTATGDLYYKSVGLWAVLFNITGPTGAAGVSPVIRNGAGVPALGLGSNGDLYINTVNGNLYEKTAGVWNVIANIMGPTGAAGAAGSSGVAVTFAYKETGSSYGPLAARALSDSTMVSSDGTAIAGISTLQITPKAAGHYIKIDVMLNCRIQKTGHAGGVLLGLFLNGTAAALASTVYFPAAESYDLYCPIHLTHFYTTAGTSMLTFDVRAAALDAGAPVTVNDKAEIPYSTISAVEMVV